MKRNSNQHYQPLLDLSFFIFKHMVLLHVNNGADHKNKA